MNVYDCANELAKAMRESQETELFSCSAKSKNSLFTSNFLHYVSDRF